MLQELNQLYTIFHINFRILRVLSHLTRTRGKFVREKIVEGRIMPIVNFHYTHPMPILPNRLNVLLLSHRLPLPLSSSQIWPNGLVKHDSKQLTRNCHIIVHSPSQSVEKKSLCPRAITPFSGGTKPGKLISLRGRRSTRSRRPS